MHVYMNVKLRVTLNFQMILYFLLVSGKHNLHGRDVMSSVNSPYLRSNYVFVGMGKCLLYSINILSMNFNY
jgi:hypothetical protein